MSSNEQEISLSIEDTNKLRKSLGNWSLVASYIEANQINYNY